VVSIVDPNADPDLNNEYVQVARDKMIDILNPDLPILENLQAEITENSDGNLQITFSGADGSGGTVFSVTLTVDPDTMEASFPHRLEEAILAFRQDAADRQGVALEDVHGQSAVGMAYVAATQIMTEGYEAVYYVRYDYETGDRQDVMLGSLVSKSTGIDLYSCAYDAVKEKSPYALHTGYGQEDSGHVWFDFKDDEDNDYRTLVDVFDGSVTFIWGDDGSDEREEVDDELLESITRRNEMVIQSTSGICNPIPNDDRRMRRF